MDITHNKLNIYDIIGGTEVCDFHSKEPILAYVAGNILIIWDFVEDIKFQAEEHPNKILLCKFFGSAQRFIISIDSGLGPRINIIEWESLKKVATLDLPRQKTKKERPINFLFEYNSLKNLMVIIENNIFGYTVSLLSFIEFSVKIDLFIY